MVKTTDHSSTLYTVKEGGWNWIHPLCVSIGIATGDLQMDMQDFTGGLRLGRSPPSQPPIGDVDAYEQYKDCRPFSIYHGRCSLSNRIRGWRRQEMAKTGKWDTVQQQDICAHCMVTRPGRWQKRKTRDEKLDWLKAAADRWTNPSWCPRTFLPEAGGRLTPVAAAVGSLLKLKPIAVDRGREEAG